MNALAAVLTGRGAAAIGSIQLIGADSESVLDKIFVGIAQNKPKFTPGKILFGNLIDGQDVVDQVTIGCEGRNNFAINCHGNPLIVQMIIELLRRNGVKIVAPADLLKHQLTAESNLPEIDIEARIAAIDAKTLEGVKIIFNQTMEKGLSAQIKLWLDNIDSFSLQQIQDSAKQILQDSRTAALIINGCRIVIAGPPNSGKSTLLNCLCGRQKSIVTDIAGTTRDWVSAVCKADRLSIEFFDTAGLDTMLAGENPIDKAAQEKAISLIAECDLVLLVLDNSRGIEQLDRLLMDLLQDRKILTVLNKSDLPSKFDKKALPSAFSRTVEISSLRETGIDNLSKAIPQILGVADFDISKPVCFTGRQKELFRRLSYAKTKSEAVSAILELAGKYNPP